MCGYSILKTGIADHWRQNQTILAKYLIDISWKKPFASLTGILDLKIFDTIAFTDWPEFWLKKLKKYLIFNFFGEKSR